MTEKEYTPFQNLAKVKIHRILNYGRPYTRYTRYRLSSNLEGITDIYVDTENATPTNANPISHHVEIHYSPDTNKSTPMRSCILADSEIDALIAKYGCKL